MIGRIQRRATFEALRKSRRRARCGPVSVSFVADGAGIERAPGRPRVDVAYAIGRRAGGAVQRNGIRRRLRVLADRHEALVPAGSLLISVSPDAARTSFAQLDEAVAGAFSGLARAASGTRARP